MQSSLWIGATGLTQHQKALDVVSNNVANVNTTAFKGSRIQFQDVFSQTIKLGGAPTEEALSTANPIQRGYGVALGAITKNFNQGQLELTGRKLDVALQGPGFFVTRSTDATNNASFYTRDGHFQIDALGGVDPSYPLDPSTLVPGPINLVTAEGYALQGVNATLDPVTGEYVLPGAASLADITFDPSLPIGPLATSAATFGLNLDAVSPLSLDSEVLEIENQEVDRTFRIEFQKARPDASNGDSYHFFSIQNPVQNPDGSYTTLTDGVTGTPITGVIRLGAGGVVTGVFQNTDADNYLTTAEAAALTPWANVNGAGNPIFTVGTAPVVGIAGEAATRPAVPAAIPLVLGAPAAFSVSAGLFDAGSVVVTHEGQTLVNGVDYTETPATGTITPLTAWDPGDSVINYTTGGGTVIAPPETFPIANALGNINFQAANPPIAAGTLVVNATRGGAALVENTDYTVDYVRGIVTPVTFWDAGAVTMNYSQADTRVEVEHNINARPITFRTNTPQVTESLTVEPRTPEELELAGTAMTAFDSLGNAHNLAYSFERLSENRWAWQATPTYRTVLDATAVLDDAAGGGTTLDGTSVLGNSTLIANADGTFQIDISIDEGNGAQTWIQIPTTDTFAVTGGGTRFFKVVDPVAGTIAFSRDLATTDPDFAINTLYKSSTTTGEGILAFDLNGDYDAVNSTIITPLTFTPQNAAALAVAADFTLLTQTGHQSDITVTDSNGFAQGDPLEWNFDNEGRIVVDYSNGLQQRLAQVVLARFANPEGMLARGETTFMDSANVGARTLYFGGETSQSPTTIVAGALELSNVDISEEFANMIIFQRAYQFNSRIITTSDEMTKEAIQLKR
jgi:flagellar hook protein FlgE